MHDQDPINWHTIAEGLAWLVSIMFGLIFRTQMKRIDRLEAHAAKKADIEQWTADGDKRHKDNTARLDRIETGITGTHKRIDQLYRDLMKRGVSDTSDD